MTAKKQARNDSKKKQTRNDSKKNNPGMTAKKQARNDSYMSIIPRLRSNRPGICEFPYFLNHQYSLSHIMIKNSQTL